MHLHTPRHRHRMLFPASVADRPRFPPQPLTWSSGLPLPEPPSADITLPVMSFGMIASGYGRKFVRIRATPQLKLFRCAALKRSQMHNVVPGRDDHQHDDNREPDPEPEFLGPFAQGAAPDGFDRVEQKVT